MAATSRTKFYTPLKRIYMNNTTIPSANQALNHCNDIKKILIYGDQYVYEKLISIGIPAEHIDFNEDDIMQVDTEYLPQVAEWCDVNEVIYETASVKDDLYNLRFNTLKRNNSLLAGSNLQELKNQFEADIVRNIDRKLIGIQINSIPVVNEKTLGLRGLIFLTAGPNCGKTALAVQFIIDAILSDDSVCAVFITLEMPPKEIAERIYTYLADITYRELHFSDRDKIRANLKEADRFYEIIIKRLLIIGAQEALNITPEALIETVEALKRSTRCRRSFIAIDYLQLWPIDEKKNFKKETDQDRWIMTQMKKLQERYVEDPVLIIAESRKPTVAGGAWGADLSDISGSARLGYAIDGSFQLVPVTDGQLEFIGETNGFEFSGSKNVKRDRFLFLLREELEFRGVSLCYLHYSKARAGAFKFKVLLEFNYHKNKYRIATADILGEALEMIRHKLTAK